MLIFSDRQYELIVRLAALTLSVTFDGRRQLSAYDNPYPAISIIQYMQVMVRDTELQQEFRVVDVSSEDLSFMTSISLFKLLWYNNYHVLNSASSVA